MNPFPVTDLINRNMNGKQDKKAIEQHHQDTVLLALYDYYGQDFYGDLVNNWGLCAKAIDKKIRNTHNQYPKLKAK